MPPDEPIRLAPYNPAWPARFEEERTALAQAIGEWIVDGIHHVGSTAVPDLEAKPVVDILVGVRDLDESLACFELAGRSGEAVTRLLPTHPVGDRSPCWNNP